MSFEVPCDSCGQLITINSVSEYRSCGKLSGYSYAYNCSCGCSCCHDGVDGDAIPDSMKRAAAVRRLAFSIRHEVDFERRELAGSISKALLRESRVATPQQLSDSTWLVYALPNDVQVTYEPNTKRYQLRQVGDSMEFATVRQLAAHLESSINKR